MVKYLLFGGAMSIEFPEGEEYLDARFVSTFL